MSNLIKDNHNLRKDQVDFMNRVISGSSISKSLFIRNAIDLYISSKQYQKDFQAELNQVKGNSK